MFRSLFPFRRLLATTFLVVFANVFVGQCWCATMNPVASTRVLLATPVAPVKPTHSGCAGHDKVTATAKQDLGTVAHAHDSSKSAGKEECCKDNSTAILKSLSTLGEKYLLSPALALLPASNDYFFRPAAGQWDRTHSVVLVLREYLPPKIPDIRIYIQSLTV